MVKSIFLEKGTTNPMSILNKLKVVIWNPIQCDPKKLSWWRLLIMTALASYLFVFMEWLFFVTKPSFMDVMNFQQKLEVLSSLGLFFCLLFLPVITILFLICMMIPKLSNGWNVFIFLGAMIPTTFLSVTSLLLIDNFSYTLLKFGIVSTQGITRALYAVALLVVFVLWFRWVVTWVKAKPQNKVEERSLATQSVFCAGIIFFSSVLSLPKLSNIQIEGKGGDENLTRRPNILLIGSDGVNAENMSVYGYERDTTPVIHKLAETSLVAANAFTNSGSTSGSITSILTSKLPTDVRVAYPPDILRGADAFQHLPGILRTHDYYSIEIGVRHYVDAYNLNFQNGFDIVNDQELIRPGFFAFNRLPAFQDTNYFLSVLLERTSDRILHLFYVRDMTNPYTEVTGDSKPQNSDRARINQLLGYFEKESEQPLFIHIHLMGTHGGIFHPSRQVFSIGKQQDEAWMTDFYDDAILEFDSFIGEVIERLSQTGKLDNTIIIIYSDHGQGYKTNRRIPLIFHFPNNEVVGLIKHNVQNIDIAPTVLDYLGLSIPEWMEGQSILSGEPELERIVFSTAVAYNVRTEEGLWVIDDKRLVPPFFQFGYMQAIICQSWFRQELRELKWTTGTINGHSAHCELPDEAYIQEKIVERLKTDGFDVTTLEEFFSTLNASEEP